MAQRARAKRRLTTTSTSAARERGIAGSPLAPLGALAAGFGFASLSFAQGVPATPPAPEPTLPPITVKSTAEPQGKDGYQATQTEIGKGKQQPRDIPQSLTVITEKLIDDRNQDTLKSALKNAAGITFEAAEGGTIGDNIRIRGFPARGDIYIDGQRDISQYNRDTFNLDRLEVLRGSASMLFGRGSTGGVINQVNKLPFGMNQNEVALTLGSGNYARATGDFNLKTGENAALRLNVMATDADNYGAQTRRRGIAPTYRFGIGTTDEFALGLYHLRYDDTPNYGIGWLNNTQAPISAKNYYGMASDYQRDSATYGFITHIHRFAGGAEWKTTLREGHFKRDLWASTIRFTGNAASGCPATAPTTINDATPLCRGTQTRAGEDVHRFLQSDYTSKATWLGFKHEIAMGIDVADENSDRYNYTGAPAKPRTFVGTPNDGAVVADSRVKALQTSFTSTSIGAYVQEMLHLGEAWKLLGGLRFDRFDGNFQRTAAAGGPLARTDSLWSHRLGVLYQPTSAMSFHASYGTSFNTSGDLYQYDLLGANTAPEKSRNIELGTKLDLLQGNLSVRAALFRTEKYNERNTDAATANPTNFLLSGKRHADGVELDLAGRITPRWEVYGSYAYIIDANIDQTTDAALLNTWPGLTPRHSGSLWSTYQVTPKLRLGAGANAMSSRTPAEGNLAFVAPRHITVDAMAEYSFETAFIKLNVINVTDKLYADQVYRGHIVAGAPRTVQLTVGSKF